MEIVVFTLAVNIKLLLCVLCCIYMNTEVWVCTHVHAGAPEHMCARRGHIGCLHRSRFTSFPRQSLFLNLGVYNSARLTDRDH